MALFIPWQTLLLGCIISMIWLHMIIALYGHSGNHVWSLIISSVWLSCSQQSGIRFLLVGFVTISLMFKAQVSVTLQLIFSYYYRCCACQHLFTLWKGGYVLFLPHIFFCSVSPLHAKLMTWCEFVYSLDVFHNTIFTSKYYSILDVQLSDKNS